MQTHMRYKPEDIFTPQGLLSEVEKTPNLDFLMNVFNIPRAFGVSGFGGSWNVGKHSVATALIALFWAKFNKFSPQKRDRLVTQALLHDLHESVTGDILPMFKSTSVKKRLEKVQDNILRALGTETDRTVITDLKIVDLIAFLYEIKQVSPSILHPKKLQLAHTIEEKQRTLLFTYAKKQGVPKEKIAEFLTELEL